MSLSPLATGTACTAASQERKQQMAAARQAAKERQQQVRGAKHAQEHQLPNTQHVIAAPLQGIKAPHTPS